MDMIREQQNQMIRLQQAAKAQLDDLERERRRNETSNLLAQEGAPNYDSVTEVQDDVSSLMNRMRTLSTFVENQNELANMLGTELLSDELLAEQAMLQKKVEDLKAKRGQMSDLVNELQSMNNEANLNFNGGDSAEGGPRAVPMERIIPMDLLSQSENGNQLQTANSGTSLNSDATLMNDFESEIDNNDSEMYDSESLATGPNQAVVAEKLAEINAMKDQLKRLQNMMTTVKLIENKVNGPDPVEMARATQEVDRLINEIPAAPAARRSVSVVAERPQPEPERTRPPMDSSELEPILSERVQTLHAMTADLREQAISLAAERDRLRIIKDEMVRRKAEEEASDRASERSGSRTRDTTATGPGATSLNYNNGFVQNENRNRDASEQRQLKADYEVKKREYESILQKMQKIANERRSVSVSRPALESSTDNQETIGNGLLSKKMQNDQMVGFGDNQSPAINPTPWRRAPSVSSPLISGQQSLPTQQNMSATIAQLQDQQTMFQQGLNGPSNYNQEQGGLFNNGSMDVGSNFPRGDSILLQQFIQTQQMLINSISQCNQLLWAQQRELNNLNNAVLMVRICFD